MILRYIKSLIITLFIVNISCVQEEKEAFSFVQLCDTQLGMGGYAHDLRSFEQAVKQINELSPDFVLICGDLVHTPSDSSFADFIKIKDGFEIPCYPAPGNHDVGLVPSDSTLNYYRKTIGKDYYEFLHKGHSFIVVNSQFWKVNVENETENHNKWLKETLNNQSLKQRPVFVIGHYPLYTEFPEEEETYYNIPLAKRQELLNLFQQSNVKAYLSGHTHKRTMNNYKNIQLMGGETTSKNFDDNPLGFRLWEVSLDTIKHQFIPLKL